MDALKTALKKLNRIVEKTTDLVEASNPGDEWFAVQAGVKCAYVLGLRDAIAVIEEKTPGNLDTLIMLRARAQEIEEQK